VATVSSVHNAYRRVGPKDDRPMIPFRSAVQRLQVIRVHYERRDCRHSLGFISFTEGIKEIMATFLV
jgi:hypothetical protein